MQGNCLQIGIYSVFTSAAIHQSEKLDQYNKKCRQADVEMFLNSDREIVMFFPIKGMLQCTEDTVFGQNWFPMPESFYLPEKLRQKLGPGAATVIPAGSYPITKVKDGYMITF